MVLSKKDEFAKMVCLFLAEGLRTRRITVKRASEIADNVLKHINLLDTESDFLQLVKELANDFEELISLETRLLKDKASGARKDLEQSVKDFAINIISSNPNLALSILKDVSESKLSEIELKQKYPEYNLFTSREKK